MKGSNEKPHSNCDDIEQLLVNRIFDELTHDKNLLVEEHLKSCAQCCNYQNTLLNLQNSMQIGTQEKLVPNPAIRENIIQRMKTLRPEEAGILRTTWQRLKSIFQYRIPVYQSLSALALIALIFLTVNQLSFSPDQKPSEVQSLTQIETPTPAQMSVIENLEIIDQQKIGRNVKEDTTLTRFIVTTM